MNTIIKSLTRSANRSRFLFYILFFFAASNPAFAQFSGGDGTSEAPWQISNPTELAEITNHLDGHFVLLNDIDLSGISDWVPLGNTISGPSCANSEFFTGVFDGNGFTISNLTITSFGSCMGLFSKIGSEGVVSSLNITNAASTHKEPLRTGLLAGENHGTIIGVRVQGSIIGSEAIGGIAGANFGLIEKCSSEVVLNGDDTGIAFGAGGIAGFNSGTILHSIVYNSDIDMGLAAGGLAGFNQGGIIRESAVIKTSVSGNQSLQSFSGIAGITNGGTIEEVLVNVDIDSDDSSTGSGVNECNGTSLNRVISHSTRRGNPSRFLFWDTNCTQTGTQIIHNDPDTTGLSIPVIKKIFGKSVQVNFARYPFAYDGIDFDDVWEISPVTMTPIPKGIPIELLPDEPIYFDDGDGTPESPWTISEMYQLELMNNHPDAHFRLSSDIDARYSKLGFGYFPEYPGFNRIGSQGTPFTGHLDGNGYTVRSLYINKTDENNVGLFGWIGSGGEVQRLGMAFADITGQANAGGIAGVNNGTIGQSYVFGHVNAVSSAGLLAGVNNGTVTNVHVSGKVDALSAAGGLFGEHTGLASQAWAAAKVAGGATPAGVAGVSSGTFNSVFWSTDQTQIIDNGVGSGGDSGVTGLTNYAMRDQSSFAGWNFTSIWKMDDHYFPALKQNEAIFPTPGNPFSGGNGTESDPYLISDIHQLQHIDLHERRYGDYYGWSGHQFKKNGLFRNHYRQIADIDATETITWNDGKGFKPINLGSGDVPPQNIGGFTGVFDGDNYIISNLYINRPDEDNIGVFASIAIRTFLRDLYFLDSPFEVQISGNHTYISGSVHNMRLVGAQVTGRNNTGSIAGFISGNIINSSSTNLTVTGNNDVGGLFGFAGQNEGSDAAPPGTGIVYKCFTTGEVTGNLAVGGLGGTTRMTGTQPNLALPHDLVDEYYPDVFLPQQLGFIGESFSTANVSGHSQIGGLVGFFGAYIARSFSTGDVSGNVVGGERNYGGITGQGFVQFFKEVFSLSDVGDGYPLARNQSMEPSTDAYYVQRDGNQTQTGGISVSDLALRQVNGLPEFDYENDWDIVHLESIPFQRRLVASTPPELLPFPILIPFAPGSGTEEDPYEILTLQMFKDVFNDRNAHYRFHVDLDLSYTRDINDGKGWEPLGAPSSRFTGSIDGNGHTLSGLYINRPDENYVGLVGSIYTGVIRNINLTDIEVHGLSNVGGLAGSADFSTFEDITINGVISGSGEAVGGLVGIKQVGTMRRAHTSVELSGDSFVGGAIGLIIYTASEAFEYVSATGTVSATGDYLGGLIGYSYNSVIRKAHASTTLHSEGDYTGGLIGNVDEYAGSVSESYAISKITSSGSHVGGLVGRTSRPLFNVFAISEITITGAGSQHIGGGIGTNYVADITNLYAVTDFIIESPADPLLARLIGNNLVNPTVTLSGLYSDPTVTPGADADIISGTGALISATSADYTDAATMPGFDFENTWDIYDGWSYPFLPEAGPHATLVHSIEEPEGWRLMTAPLGGLSLGEVLGPIWTQGFTGASMSSGQPNVFTYNEPTQSWVAADSLNQSLTPGSGVAVYIFGKDEFDDELPTFPKVTRLTGTRNDQPDSVPLHLTLSDTDPQSGTPVYDSQNDGWNLAGNPLPVPVDWDAPSGWERTGLSASFYVWDPLAGSTGAYRSWNGISGTLDNGIIQPWQGIWIKANNPMELPFFSANIEAQANSGGNEKERTEKSRISLHLSDGQRSSDAIVLLHASGKTVEDHFDALKLESLSPDYLHLYTETEDGYPMDIQSLPYKLEETIELKIGFGNPSSDGTLTLKWEADDLSEGTIAELVISETGEVIKIEGSGEFKWTTKNKQKEVTSIAGNNDTDGNLISLEGSPAYRPRTLAKGSGVTPLILRLTPSYEADIEGTDELPKQVALRQNYPNPFNPSTIIPFELPVKADVRIEVFDLLGRRLVTLIDEEMQAGHHQVQFNAGNYSSGVYIYRMMAGSKVITQKMTLIK